MDVIEMETKEIEEWIKTKCKVEIAECPHVNRNCMCPYSKFGTTVFCDDAFNNFETFDKDHYTHVCNYKETQAVLSDKELMALMDESRKNYKKGECRNVEDLFKELGV